MRLAALALLAGFSTGPAIAEAPPRCAILGQMTVSIWLEMIGGLTDPNPETLDPLLSRLANVSHTYSNLGCDVPALGTAMDCLLDRSGSGAPRELARACMSEAGLSLGE